MRASLVLVAVLLGAVSAQVARTIPGFSGALGPDLSGQGYTQCAGVGSSVSSSTFYTPCNGFDNVVFACSVNNDETAEFVSAPIDKTGMNLLDSTCDDFPVGANSVYSSGHILSLDASNPGCSQFNVNYDMYMDMVSPQWGCNHVYNTHNSGGRMFMYAVTGAATTAAPTQPPTTTASCPIPFTSEWLTTAWEPVLSIADSGFLTYGRAKDIISVAFDNANGYNFQSATIGSASEATANHGNPNNDVTANSAGAQYTNDKHCYTRYEVYSTWGDVVSGCSSAIVGNFREFTCKLTVTNKEPLDPIRGETLERTIISDIPYIVRFPLQVSTSITGLSAFEPPNVLAAVVRQEVIVDVTDLTNLSTKIKLYTSVQWPFRLTAPVSTANPSDISTNSFALDGAQCADPAAGDVANPAVDDANACGQVWLLDLDVLNGAAGAPCELDGNYQVVYQAECQPSWPSDCPLVPDDQGQIQNQFQVNFVIDSEWFCPRVVDQVDVAASIAVFKDIAHTIPASNFILGQTAYFVASVTSSKVTVVKAEVNLVSITLDGASPAIVYNVANGAHCDAADAGDANAVNALAVQDGPCENGEQAEAWWNFLIDATSVPGVPNDGSKDYSVSVTLDVEFKNAGPLLEKRQVQLLQAFGSNGQQAGASISFAASASADDADTAGAVTKSVTGVAALVAGLALSA